MLSMFKEKDGDGKETTSWSMTRVVAFLAALTLNSALIVMAHDNHAHDIAWPFAWMYIVTLMAIPIKELCKMIQTALNTAPGQKLLKTMVANTIAKVETSGLTLLGGGAAVPAVLEAKITTQQGESST
jgi:hypothetical protein